MKKLIALALAIFMIAAMAVPAFAASVTLQDGTLVDPGVDYGNENEIDENGAPIGDADDSITQGTDLIYGVSQSYVVSIPSDVIFEEELTGVTAAEGVLAKTKNYIYASYEIGLYDVIIAKEEKMQITVTSENNWTLVDEEGDAASDAVNYYLTNDAYLTSITAGENRTAATEWMGSTQTAGSPVLTVAVASGNAGTQGSQGSTNIYFSSLGTAQEGTYEDTITFTVAVVPAA